MSFFCCTFADEIKVVIVKMSELEYTEQGWRMTTDPGRHHREKRWDYKGRGIYHITLVMAERYPLLGSLVGETAEEAHIAYNNFGKEISKILQNLPEFYKEKGVSIKMLAIQIMPDHIHMAIQVLEPMNRSIGEIVRSTKSACTSLYKKHYAVDGGNNTAKVHNIDAIDGGNNTTKVHNIDAVSIVHFSRIFTRIGSIWEQDRIGYHERILHRAGQLDAMIHYIKDNPRRLWLKRATPDLFRIHQQTPVGGVPCTTLGNMFLADSPIREALHCSRTLSQVEIDRLRDQCLTHAANGTVYISPAIAEGEKQICRALREAGYPLIIILSEGFPSADSPHYKYYKPSGVYFEACAAGKLLLIEPDATLFERRDIEKKVYAKTGEIPHNTKRYRFVAQNAIAELVAEWDNRALTQKKT